MAGIVGADRILFGSDYPLLSPRRIMDQVSAAALPGEAKSAIMGGNARRLLGWT